VGVGLEPLDNGFKVYWVAHGGMLRQDQHIHIINYGVKYELIGDMEYHFNIWLL